jgi:hypothetical protein
MKLFMKAIGLPGPSVVVGRLSGKPMAGQAADALRRMDRFGLPGEISSAR